MTNGIRILTAKEILTLLEGKNAKLIQSVRSAYETHQAGRSALPHSTFLLFPDRPKDRIIALPAYLGQEFELAGIKWIASFPENSEQGLDRASAVIIVNSLQTGRPEAILEGSIISARRTAASAALAAQYLHLAEKVEAVGIVGSGVINFEIARFLLSTFSSIQQLIVFDTSTASAQQFKNKCLALNEKLEVQLVEKIQDVFRQTALISFATTAAEPYVTDLADCQPGSTLLHISLRDLAPEVILNCDNVVDDVDHVCRARTSVHLAEQRTGNRDFIRCTLADITSGRFPPRNSRDGITVFSPFGLGVLDLAVSQLVLELAEAQGQGTLVPDFFPTSWHGAQGQT